jgi:hypothetical protein
MKKKVFLANQTPCCDCSELGVSWTFDLKVKPAKLDIFSLELIDSNFELKTVGMWETESYLCMSTPL